jgi:release factor glutamine methyltransferase
MPKTYNELYIDARKKLKETGISSYSLEARLIVACASGKSREEFLSGMNLYTSSDVAQKADEMVARRLKGEPVAYITGDWEFYGLPMAVTRDVLIPRVDTEVLAELAITALRGRKMDARIIDLCTGSGCLGCAIAKALPATTVVLADNSERALAVARRNVQKNKLNPRVTCVNTDARVNPPMMLGSFDLMVCNPPYIPTAELEALDASVREYEPMTALDGGGDGLDFYRDILKSWRGVVRVGGMMMFEVGVGQAEEVKTIMRVAGLKNIGSEKDTLGIDRVVFGNV